TGSSFFFFQAEDGIRDGHVTGVQTCALPIYEAASRSGKLLYDPGAGACRCLAGNMKCRETPGFREGLGEGVVVRLKDFGPADTRSEERRVGKECRSRWSPDDWKKRKKQICTV